jgi:hypothetical protein
MELAAKDRLMKAVEDAEGFDEGMTKNVMKKQTKKAMKRRKEDHEKKIYFRLDGSPDSCASEIKGWLTAKKENIRAIRLYEEAEFAAIKNERKCNERDDVAVVASQEPQDGQTDCDIQGEEEAPL